MSDANRTSATLRRQPSWQDRNRQLLLTRVSKDCHKGIQTGDSYLSRGRLEKLRQGVDDSELAKGYKVERSYVGSSKAWIGLGEIRIG